MLNCSHPVNFTPGLFSISHNPSLNPSHVFDFPNSSSYSLCGERSLGPKNAVLWVLQGKTGCLFAGGFSGPSGSSPAQRPVCAALHPGNTSQRKTCDFTHMWNLMNKVNSEARQGQTREGAGWQPWRRLSIKDKVLQMGREGPESGGLFSQPWFLSHRKR